MAPQDSVDCLKIPRIPVQKETLLGQGQNMSGGAKKTKHIFQKAAYQFWSPPWVVPQVLRWPASSAVKNKKSKETEKTIGQARPLGAGREKMV